MCLSIRPHADFSQPDLTRTKIDSDHDPLASRKWILYYGPPSARDPGSIDLLVAGSAGLRGRGIAANHLSSLSVEEISSIFDESLLMVFRSIQEVPDKLFSAQNIWDLLRATHHIIPVVFSLMAIILKARRFIN